MLVILVSRVLGLPAISASLLFTPTIARAQRPEAARLLPETTVAAARIAPGRVA